MPPVAQAMKNDYPEVQDATRLQVGGAPKITYKDKSFKDDEMAYVDPNFFNIFTLPLIKGDAKTALQQPNTLIKQMAMPIDNPAILMIEKALCFVRLRHAVLK